MSTIEPQTLTGLEIDNRPARGKGVKIAKWLSGSFVSGPHLNIRWRVRSLQVAWSVP
ncbi:hypothetical protein ACVDG5_005455 [Mesorhizobium sp. ORM6]